MLKIVLVDDQTLFSESLKNILEMRTKDIRIVGIAQNGMEAINVVNETKPDIVLMDVRMPEMDGVEAAAEIHKSVPNTKIMMLTTFDDDEYVHEALKLGAVGYLLKTTRPAELIASIRAIKEGIVQISPVVAAKLIREQEKRKLDNNTISVEKKPEWANYLSHREKEILKLLLIGLSNLQIAERLCIAEQTVKNHLTVVYSKMNAHSRPQVIRKIIDSDINLSSY
jgi:DNA-binding NarL/FixJ family response regulator